MTESKNKREKHQHNNRAFDGFRSAFDSLEKKLRELRDLHNLQKHQNEKENVRGFSEGGSSVKSSGKGDAEVADIEAQISMIEEQMREIEDAVETMSEELDEVITELGGETNSQKAQKENPGQEYQEQLEQVAQKYRDRGIDCEVEIGEDGAFGIKVKEPGKYQGQDLLEMTENELKEMIDELAEEKAPQEDKEKEKEGEKEEEASASKGKSKTIVVEEKEENKDKKDEHVNNKVMKLLGGDVIPPRDDEDQTKGMLVAQKAIGKKEKNPKEKKSKDKDDDKDEDVAIPSSFDDSGFEDDDLVVNKKGKGKGRVN